MLTWMTSRYVLSTGWGCEIYYIPTTTCIENGLNILILNHFFVRLIYHDALVEIKYVWTKNNDIMRLCFKIICEDVFGRHMFQSLCVWVTFPVDCYTTISRLYEIKYSIYFIWSKLVALQPFKNYLFSQCEKCKRND